MKVEILWGIKEHTYQLKSFKDEPAAVEWCRKHAKDIYVINGQITAGKTLSHIDLVAALRGADSNRNNEGKNDKRRNG